MKPTPVLRSFLLGSVTLAIISSPVAHAFTYYWDNNSSTANFGSAFGTWAAPTTGNATQGWSQNSGGTVIPVNVTTGTADLINFGSGAGVAGLGAGPIAVSGTVESGSITFASGSGLINLSGGTITLAASPTITVNNSVNIVGSVLGGAATSLTKAGTGTLILSGENTYAGVTNISAGTLVARNSSSLGTGAGTNVSVATNTGLTYNAAADTQLAVGGNLGITGGASTVIGASIGATASGAQINVAGDATTNAAAVKVNIYGVNGVTHFGAGSATLINAAGGGSTLNNATYTLGAVYNNTDFTVGALSASATQLTVATTSAAALTTAYWKGGSALGNNVWAVSDGSTQSNWVSTSGGANQALVPGSGTDVFISNSTVTTAPTATVLGSDMSIKSLTIADTVNNFALNTNGYALTIGSGGITKQSATSARTAAISSAINLAAAQTWNTGGGTLTVTGGVNNNGHTMTFDGAGTTSFTSTSYIISGSGGITKNGSGTLTLGAAGATPAHNYSGTTTVNAGALMVHSFNLGSGNLTINEGYLDAYFGGTFTRALGTGAGQVQITGGTSGFSSNGNTGTTITLNNSAATEAVWATATFNPTVFVLQASTAQGGSSLTFSNNLDLKGATRTVSVAGGTTGAARAVMSGVIRNTTGTAGFTKTGTGTLQITNASSAWNGSTTVSGGLLDLGAMTNANIGAGVGVRDITVAAGAGVKFNALSNAFLNRLVETTDEITVMTGATANNLDFSSSTGANLPNAFLGNYATNGAKMEYSGTLTPASDNYRIGGKFSSGLLGIVGTNKLTGTQGLIVGGTGATGIRVNVAAAQNFTGETVINTGAKLTIGHNLALQNSALNVGAAGGNFALAAGSNAGRITGETAAASPTFGGLIGSRNLLTVFTNAAGNNETNLASTAVTGFTLNPGAGKSYTYSGAIANFAAGTTITKTGLGTQILSGANTYTGGTTITTGTLQFAKTNSMPATGAVGVGTGATLAVNASGVVGEFTNATSGAGSIGGLLAGIGGQGAAVNYTGDVALGIDTTNAGGSLTYSGVIGNVGTTLGITKLGTGTLVLDQANTYSGATTIKAGTLALDTLGSFDNSPTIVVGDAGSSGTVLDLTAKGSYAFGSGQTVKGIGTINIGAGNTLTIAGKLAPGNSIGTNSVVGNLTLAGTADFELGTAGASHASPGTSDLTNVSGSLTLGGALNLIDNAAANGNGSIGGGSYLLFTQSGTAAGAFSSINNAPGFHANVDTSTSGSVFLDNYRFAAPNTITNPVNLGNVRVGGTFGTSALNIQNTAANDGFSEGLNAAQGATTGSATVFGTDIANLAPGSSSSTISVGLGSADTSTAGAKTGTVAIDLATNGSGSSGYGVTALSGQTVTVNGSVFNAAAANTIDPVDVGKTRVGGSFGTTPVGISNTAPAGIFTEGLNATVASTTGDASGSGSISNLAGGSSGTSLLAGLAGANTTTSGVRSGSITIDLASSGTNSGLSDLSLASQTVGVSGTVYDYAVAAFSQTGGDGVLLGSGNSYTLDFGTGLLLNTTYTATIQLANTLLSGFQDSLGGSYNNIANGFNSGVEGSTITSLVAGNSNTFTITFNTGTDGTFTDTLSFAGLSQQSGLSDASLGTYSFALSATAIPEPRAALLGGLGMLALLRRRRR